MASKKQRWLIKKLAQEQQIDPEDLDAYCIRTLGAALDNWQFDTEKASRLINDLKEGKVR